MKHSLLFICIALFLSGTLFAQEAASVANQFAAQLADMQSDDANKVKNAQQDWQKICFQAGTPGQNAKKAEAVKLMAQALEQVDLKDSTKYWFIRQLGRLDNGDHAALIGKFVADANRTVRDEAIGALSNIPNARAGRVLAELRTKETDANKKLALQHALNFRAQRKTVDLPKLDAILKSLEAENFTGSDHLLPNLPWLTDVKISDVPRYRERFAKLTPRAQVLLMDALAVCRDQSAVPLALEMVKSEDEQIRLAGFRALGPLGNTAVLPVLLENIRGPGDFGDTVRNSLAQLNFAGADKVLIETYQKTNDNAVKYDLTRVFMRRAGTIAVPAVEAGLKSDDENLRRISIQFLENLGQQASIPVLVERYFAETKDDIRGAVERAIVQIESRYNDADGRGKAFCDAIAKRSETEQVRLLPILGRISGSHAQEFVMKQYTSGSSAIREAAFSALCNWTNVAVADELFKVASAQDDSRSAAAARAYIRIVTMYEDGRSDENKLAYVEKAMSIAKTDEDKRFLLERLDPSRCIGVFRFAVKYIDDPNLDQAVCRAIVDLANDTGFHMSNRAEIEPFLDKVIEKSKDKGHVDRAKRYKERR